MIVNLPLSKATDALTKAWDRLEREGFSTRWGIETGLLIHHWYKGEPEVYTKENKLSYIAHAWNYVIAMYDDGADKTRIEFWPRIGHENEKPDFRAEQLRGNLLIELRAIEVDVASVDLLPKRDTDRAKWQSTWRLIQEWVDKGMNPKDIEKRFGQLEGVSHLPGDAKTLRKIIAAGKAGHFDDLP